MCAASSSEYRADRQKAPLDVRGELERLAVLVHLVLDEHLDSVRGDYLADSLEQHIRRDRLRQIVAYRVVENLLEEAPALLRVERGEEEDRHGGVEAADYVAEHEPVHIAHHDVRYDGAERVGVLLELRDCRLNAVDRNGVVAHLLQLRAESEPYQLLVVDDQYLRLAVRVGSHSFPPFSFGDSTQHAVYYSINRGSLSDFCNQKETSCTAIADAMKSGYAESLRQRPRGGTGS